MASALIAALATLALPACEPAGPAVYVLRFVTGMCMAGVYPRGDAPGRDLSKPPPPRDLGLVPIGLLVGALDAGLRPGPASTGLFGGMQWPQIYLAAAALAAAASWRSTCAASARPCGARRG